MRNHRSHNQRRPHESRFGCLDEGKPTLPSLYMLLRNQSIVPRAHSSSTDLYLRTAKTLQIALSHTSRNKKNAVIIWQITRPTGTGKAKQTLEFLQQYCFVIDCREMLIQRLSFESSISDLFRYQGGMSKQYADMYFLRLNAIRPYLVSRLEDSGQLGFSVSSCM